MISEFVLQIYIQHFQNVYFRSLFDQKWKDLFVLLNTVKWKFNFIHEVNHIKFVLYGKFHTIQLLQFIYKVFSLVFIKTVRYKIWFREATD